VERALGKGDKNRNRATSAGSVAFGLTLEEARANGSRSPYLYCRQANLYGRLRLNARGEPVTVIDQQPKRTAGFPTYRLEADHPLAAIVGHARMIAGAF